MIQKQDSCVEYWWEVELGEDLKVSFGFSNNLKVFDLNESWVEWW